MPCSWGRSWRSRRCSFTCGSLGSSIASTPSRGGAWPSPSRGAASRRRAFRGSSTPRRSTRRRRSPAGGKNGIAVGEVIGACVSAPLVEEFWKGLAVFGIFFFLRREFDGVVDGIIYGTFAALGFAATENVMYYSRAQLTETLSHHEGALATTFVLRGVLFSVGAPALHVDDRYRIRHRARDREGVAQVARARASATCSRSSCTRCGTERPPSRACWSC